MEPRMQRKQISPATVGDADRALNVWPMQLCQARDNPLCRQPRPVPRRLQRRLGAALVGIVIAMALVNSSVQAADFTANDTTTLTDAINSANDETTNPGADTITLTDDVTLSAALPTITSKVTRSARTPIAPLPKTSARASTSLVRRVSNLPTGVRS